MRRGRERSLGPAPPPHPEALAVRPVRTADWSETAPKERGEASAGGAAEARVVIERPLPPVRSISTLLQRISALTGVRRLRLDAPGSFVWRRMDGSRTAGELADELRSELERSAGPEAGADAEARVVRFVALLRREDLIGLPGLDDGRIEAWRARGSIRGKGRPEGPGGNPRH